MPQNDNLEILLQQYEISPETVTGINQGEFRNIVPVQQNETPTETQPFIKRAVGKTASLTQSVIPLASFPQRAIETYGQLVPASQMLEESREQLAQSTIRLIQKMQTLSENDPNKDNMRKLIDDNMKMVRSLGIQSEELQKQFLSGEEIARKTGSSLINVAAFGGVPQTPVQTGAGLGQFAKTALVRASQTGTIFGATGAASELEKGGGIKDITKTFTQQYGLGALLSGLVSTGKVIVKEGLPRLISYSSDIPQEAINRLLKNPKVVNEATRQTIRKGDEITLKEGQDAIKGLRKQLSKEWEMGVNYFENKIHKLNPVMDNVDTTIIFSDSGEQQLLKNVAKKYGIKLKEKMNIRDMFELNKNINALYAKKVIRESAEGAYVRNLSKLVRERLINLFGGPEVDEFLKNYAAELEMFKGANRIMNAYTKDPVKLSTALGRLKSIYNENKGAYISTLQKLEEKTGVNILDKVAGMKFQKILPAKSGKFGFDEILRIIAFPITSPRLVKGELTLLGKGTKMLESEKGQIGLKTAKIVGSTLTNLWRQYNR